MNNAIIFLSIIIILLSIMLIIKIDIIFDLYGNYVNITIRIFSLKILNIYISIIGLYIKINNSKKFKTLNLILDEKEEYLFLQIKKSIIDKLYFDVINISSCIGLPNAGDSVIISSLINLICENLKYNKRLISSECDIDYLNSVNFTRSSVFLEISTKVYFTIFDLIFALCLSFYKRGKYVKERKRKSR